MRPETLHRSTKACVPQEHRGNLDKESVLEALSKICYNWKLIGTALDIDMSMLKRIEYVYPHHPESALLEVVKEWLVAEHSWEELVKALRGRSLSENQLAAEIEENYCKSDIPRKQPVLNERLQRVIEASSAIEIHSHPLSPLQEFALRLRSSYSGTNESRFPQTASTCEYINLATVIRNPKINRSQADAFTKDTLHRGIDEIVAKKERLDMKDILKPMKGQSSIKLVLVEGPPGVGKSTFAWELCRQWDNVPDLKKFSLVVLLRFRDKWVQEAKCISDLFYHDDPDIKKSVVDEICRRSGAGVLFVLDGFDEFPASLRENSLLLDLMKGSRCLSRCTVIVTTRPSVTIDLFEECKVDKYVEVLGFTQTQIEEYSHVAFKSDPQLLSKFQKFCKINPAIRSAMYIPLNTVIVADVFLSDGEPLSHTITQLYFEMSIVILKAHFKKSIIDCTLAKRLRARNFKDLPKKILDHLKNLGELAFKGITRKQVIFSELPDDFKHFGFLNTSPELHIRADPKVSYNFLHNSFQDLFAAFYISQLTASEQVEIFKTHFERREGVYQFGHDDFKEVWKFLAGLSNFEHIGWDLVESQSSIQQLVSFLYEAQAFDVPDFLLSETDDNAVFNPTTLFDCYAVGWCIGARKCKVGIAFSSLQSGPEVFVTGVNAERNEDSEAPGTVSGFRFFNTPLTEESMEHLSKLPPSVWRKISWLDVSICQMNANAFEKLADLAFYMVSLKSLSIRSNHVGECGLVKLFNVLSTHGCLEKLRMGDNVIGCADVNALSKLITIDGGCLKNLVIKGERAMSPNFQQALVKAIFSPSSIEVLSILDLKVPAATHDIALLANNHNLKNIVVATIREALPLILAALEKNTSVEALKIDCTQAHAPAFVKMLGTNKSIQCLKIKIPPKYGNEVRRSICLDIILALKHNSTLKELGLYLANKKLFTQTELDAMDPRVKLHEHTDTEFAI